MMNAVVGLALLCGLLLTVTSSEESRGYKHNDPIAQIEPVHNVKSKMMTNRLTKRSAETDQSGQLKRSQRDIYKILDRLPELPHVFGGKRSPVADETSPMARAQSKRSWNTPPILTYIYTRKPFYGFGKRAVLQNTAENEKAYISVEGMTKDTNRAPSPLELFSEEEVGAKQGPDNRQHMTLAFHRLLNEQTPGAFFPEVGDKRSWGAKPMKWNRLRNKPIFGSFGKRLDPVTLQDLFDPDVRYKYATRQQGAQV